MYTRRFDEHRPPPDGYSGTFMTKERPTLCENPTESPEPSQTSENSSEGAKERQSQLSCRNSSEPCRECFGSQPYESGCDSGKDTRPGFLSGLFSRFSRGFELDDLILLGLLLLLLGERDGKDQNGDELLLVLGLLFFMGF